MKRQDADIEYITRVITQLSDRKGGQDYLNVLTSVVTFLNEIEGGMFKPAKLTREWRLDRLNIKVNWDTRNLTLTSEK